MRSGQFYDKVSGLSQFLYTNFGQNYEDWIVQDTYNTKSGVNICLFDIGNDETLFAIRGTQVEFTQELKRDLTADIVMYLAKVPNQYKHAEIYFEQIKHKYKNIIFTGYSLGGSIAQMLGGKFGNETICFEPIGTRGLQTPQYENNIINFGNTMDMFFNSKLKNQVGLLYIMPIGPNKEFYPKGIPFINTHFPQNYGKPSQAKPYKLIRDRIKDYTTNFK